MLITITTKTMGILIMEELVMARNQTECHREKKAWLD